jgi:gas vesicle protein
MANTRNTQNTPQSHTCPFEGTILNGEHGSQHVEGRFSALETQVSGLQSGLESMERSVTEGFKSVFQKIDNITTTRSAATIPWIGTFIVILGLASSMVYTSLSNQAESIRDVKSIVIQDLKDVNERLFVSQFDAGKASVHQQDMSTKLIDLDNKLQNETKLIADRIDERIKALDEKIQIEQRLVSSTNLKQMEEQGSHATDMRKWRLEHEAATSTFRGSTKATFDLLIKQIDKIEQQQYDDRMSRLNRLENKETK